MATLPNFAEVFAMQDIRANPAVALRDPFNLAVFLDGADYFGAEWAHDVLTGGFVETWMMPRHSHF